MNNVELYKMKIFDNMSHCTLDEAIELFIDNIQYMDNIDIIFVDEKKGYNPIKSFINDYKIEKGMLSTPFVNDHFYIINQRIAIESAYNIKPKIAYFFDINLDTQIVSYMDANFRGKIGENLKQVSKVFAKKRKYASSVSLGPYLIENTLFKDSISDTVYDTMLNVFTILYNKHLRFKFLARYNAKRHTNKLINYNKTFYNSDMFEILRYRYKLIYLMLLKMVVIEFSNKTFESKARKIIEFSNNKLNKIMVGELILALEFFKKKNRPNFFGKFQKNNKNIIKDIKNAAWDIYHHRELESSMLHVKNKKADITISMLYSIDKRFNEIRKLLKLKMLVIDHSTNNYYPFYENTILQDTIKKFCLEKHFTLKQVKERNKSFNFNNIDSLIKITEKVLIEQII